MNRVCWIEYYVDDTQSLHLSFGILENSEMLLVIMVRFRPMAWAAINVSKGPIV